MSGERAKRFPLALEDLKREPRKPEGLAGERQAAGDAARQRLGSATARSASQADGRVSKPATGAAASKPAKPGQTAPKPGSPRQAASPSAAPKPAVSKPAVLRPAVPKPVAPKPAAVPRPAAPKPAAPNVALSGKLALTSERVRERMVERLRANGITDPRVLNALAVVPRHMFVDPGLAAQAYEDAALPIGHQQTISKPSVVARMIELASAGRPLERVLEIGTGCGYQAAVLSQVAVDVYSIERIRPLYERAKLNLRPLRVPNIRLHYGDGRVGLPSAAPFDAIVIAAAGLDVPQALLEQLAIGGRLVAPVGAQDGQSQVLTLVERVAAAQWRESRLDRVFFVPLKSGVI